MGLLNWPPSRGEVNPHIPEVRLIPGRCEREDIDLPPAYQEDIADAPSEEEAQRQETERQAIEKAFRAEHAAAYSGNATDEDLRKALAALPDDVESPPIPIVRHEPKPLVGAFRCFYHLDTVATLTIAQADRLLTVRQVIGSEKHMDSSGREREREVLESRDSHWYGFEPRGLTVIITYPLSRAVRLHVPPMLRQVHWPHPDPDGRSREDSEDREMSPGYFLWMLAREYKRIYEEHEKYGVWGHDIDDLHFEGFEIDTGGDVELWIGS